MRQVSGWGCCLVFALLALGTGCDPEPPVVLDVVVINPPELYNGNDVKVREDWRDAADAQFIAWQNQQFVVAEQDPVATDSLGNPAPALYNVAVLIQDHLQYNALRAWDIHWSPLPILGPGLQEQYGATGRHTYGTDANGIFVYTLLPGRIYNQLLQWRAAGTPQFNSVVLLDHANEPASVSDVRVPYQDLAEVGFRYNGVAMEQPLSATNQDSLPPDVGRSQAPLLDLLVAAILLSDIAQDAAAEFISIINFVRDSIGFIGVTLGPRLELTVNLTPLTTDPAFINAATAAPHPQVQGWGAAGGAPINLEGVEIEFSWLGIGGTILSVSTRGRLDAANTFTAFVPQGQAITVRLITDSPNAIVLSFGVPNDFQFPTGPFGTATAALVNMGVSDVDVNILSQALDSHRYVASTMGFSVSKSRIMVGGPIGNFIGLVNGGAAFAPCVGHWDALPPASGGDPGALVSDFGSGGMEIPGIGGLTPTGILDGVTGADIIIPTNGAGAQMSTSRGITTHEYGHYVFCDLIARSNPATFRDIWVPIVAQTLLTNPPLPGARGAALNEGFADYIAAQVVGGTNWFVPASSRASNFVNYCDPTATNCMDDNIGGPGATAVLGGFAAPVGRNTTILHDVFDGHAVFTDSPGNGAAWTFGPALTFAAGYTPAADAMDEPVMSFGELMVRAFAGWMFTPSPLIVADFDGTFFHAITQQLRIDGVPEAAILALYAAHGPVPPGYVAFP